MQIVIRDCNVTDLEILREIAIKTYDETFRDFNAAETMRAYLDAAFERGRLKDELENPYSSFYFMLDNGEPVGYLKLNEDLAQTDLKDPHSMEIERIYIKDGFQGQGLGKCLMEKACDVAKQKKKSYVWLGVWEKNISAIAFYRKMGFVIIGTHDFYMGEEKQTDYVMRKELA